MKVNAITPLFLFQCESNGSAREYPLPAEIGTKAGQAKSIRYQFIGERRSPTARLHLKMYESPFTEVRASQVNPANAAFHTSGNIDVLRPAPTGIPGPFSTNVEFLVKIEDSGAANEQEWYGRVAFTFIMEE